MATANCIEHVLLPQPTLKPKNRHSRILELLLFIIQVEKSFLQNEGGCRDGVNYEKGCQQEDASADN